MKLFLTRLSIAFMIIYSLNGMESKTTTSIIEEILSEKSTISEKTQATSKITKSTLSTRTKLKNTLTIGETVGITVGTFFLGILLTSIVAFIIFQMGTNKKGFIIIE
jgi:hypothetical protein